MPQALALAVSNIVSYYLPALVPSARDNFSQWFSFHLSNTDYQWPSGYWEHWAEYVTNGKRNSRGDFVLRSLSLMASQLNDVESLVADCLPPGSVLPKYLLASDKDDTKADETILSIQRDVEARIWEKNEDPDLLRAYVIGDELSETVKAANLSMDWWRSGLAVRALLQPATRQHKIQREAIQRTLQSSDENAMEEDNADPEDVLVMLTENLVRYRGLLLAALASDAETNDKSMVQPKTTEVEQLAIGGATVLKQLENVLQYSRVLLESCTTCVVENEIVSGQAVLRWVLGDVISDGKDGANLVQRWWEFANIAIRIGINRALASLDSDTQVLQPSGMVIDRGEGMGKDPNSKSFAVRRMTSIVENIDPIVQYMTKRVCSLLQQADDGKKKLTPDMIDLVEGLKQCVLATKILVMSKLTEGGSCTEKEGHDLWSSSSICGSRLASVAAKEGSGHAVETLTASLLAM
jgi:hypothetical protein